MSISPARFAAFNILKRVELGGYASDLLRATNLDSRDAGLASEIVLGALRYQNQLDFVIGQYVALSRLDSEVLIALRIGAYQLRFLDRVPAHAAVSESVELIKQSNKRSASGLVNAVLRKVPKPLEWPGRAIALSCPEWLLSRWDAHFGTEVSSGIAEAALHAPERYMRGDRMQDIGSQSIVPLLDLKPGQRFLDLCAAPGNKTAQAMEAGVEAVACDLHLHRLREVDAVGCRRVVLDATAPLPFSGEFDRILVDAPCSGTGTLGRNPEIKWRLRPADLPALQRKQKAILTNALAAAAPQAKVVYSTCSLEPEENEEVIAAMPGKWALTQRIPGRDAGDGFFAAVLELR